MLARKGLLGLFNRTLVSPKNINKVNPKRKLMMHYDQSMYAVNNELHKAQVWFDDTRSKLIANKEKSQHEDVKRFYAEKNKIDSLHNFMYFIVAECRPASDCSLETLQFKKTVDLAIMRHVANIGTYYMSNDLYTKEDAFQDIFGFLDSSKIFSWMVANLNELNMSDEFKMFLMKWTTGETFSFNDLQHFKRPLNGVIHDVNPTYFIQLHLKNLNHNFFNQDCDATFAKLEEKDNKLTSDFYAESIAKTEPKVTRARMR